MIIIILTNNTIHGETWRIDKIGPAVSEAPWLARLGPGSDLLIFIWDW